MSDKVTQLPVKPRKHDRCLEVMTFEPERCQHTGSGATYKIRPGEAEVECGMCGVRLDPMFVLTQMANMESMWLNAQRRYIDVRKELEKRTRCKCYFCGRMTPIRGL